MPGSSLEVAEVSTDEISSRARLPPPDCKPTLTLSLSILKGMGNRGSTLVADAGPRRFK